METQPNMKYLGPHDHGKEIATLNRLISVGWRLVLEPTITQNTKCHLKVQLVLEH